MFSSTRISDAGLLYKSDKDNSLDETTNKSFLRPKITSTPLRRESIFATPPKPRILSPRRYSLSEVATPPRSNRKNLSISNSYRNAPGPLLASTTFNVNVSTYEDTKTPGLAGRIVQYNEEAEQEKDCRRHPTHQAQYGTVGLFPIVHLFKKKLPLLQKKPKHVTVRIASPDYARQHNQEYNRKLLESIVKPGGGGFGFLKSKNEIASTRSVLDALKEISRKRMHASEELEVYEDSGKRLRTDNSDIEETPEGNKRQRDDSPLETSPSPSRQTSKKICMYDEYAASCSSMDYKKLEPLIPKRKLISISTLTDNPKESKQVKLISVETQTPQEALTDKSASAKDNDHEENQTDIDESLSTSRESVLKVFDDTPLERIRTNRLAALLGSLAGKDAVLVPKPNISSTFNGETTESSILNTTDKPLVSILSTPNKSPHKTDRHVHFSIPESTHQTTGTFSSLTSISSSTTDLVNVSSSASSQTVGTTRLAIPTSLSPDNLVPTSTALNSSTTLGTSGFAFGATMSKASPVKSSNSSSALISKEPALNPTASIAFGKPSVSNIASTSMPVSAQLNFPLPTSSSPPKMGGFKFDLNKPTSAAVSIPNDTQSVTSSSLLFPSSQKPKSQDPPFGSAPRSVVSPTFSFGSKVAAPTTTSSTPNATSIVSTTASTSTTPSFNFAASKNNDSTSTDAANKGHISSASLFTPGSAATLDTDASKTSTFSFGGTTQATGVGTSTPFAFGTPKADTATAPTSVTSDGFGGSAGFTATSAPSSLAPNFAASTPFIGTTLNLSQTNKPGTTSAPTFGNTSISTTPLFGSTSTSTASPFGSNPVFGQSTTQASFVAPSTTSSFSASNAFGSTNPSTTASFMFAGSNNVSGTAPKIFGGTTVTQATGFGAPVVTQASGFGAPVVTQASGFGAPVVTQPSGFGTPTTNSLFGTSFGSTVTTAASAFGSTAPTFTFGPKTNNTTNVGFGAPTTTSSFGAPSGTGFGATSGQSAGFGTPTSNAPAFGAMNSAVSGFGTTTSTSGGFGAAASTGVGFGANTTVNAVAPTFGATNSFGSGTTFAPNSAFGGAVNTANNSSFGTITTTQPGAFGATSPPSFGSAATKPTGSFATPTAPTFGGFGTPSKDSAFGNTPAASFGTPAQPGVFGAPTSNAPSFGATGSAFGKPQSATTNMFGGTPSSNAVPNAFGSGNAFTTNPQQGTGGFGTTNPTTNPGAAFNFGAAPNQTAPKPSGVFSFGGATPASGDKSKFNFNAAFTAPPPFSSTSTRFDGGVAPSFGGTATPAFGGTAPPSFGGTAPPSFGGTATPSFGGTATPSFGNTSAPSFGAAAQPSFGAAQPAVPGTFSIGSGSSASGRPRTQIKAKRRT